MQILQATARIQDNGTSTIAPGTIKECTKAGIAVQCGSGELLITQLKLTRARALRMLPMQ